MFKKLLLKIHFQTIEWYVKLEQYKELIVAQSLKAGEGI